MKKVDWRKMKVQEVGAAIWDHLAKHSIKTVLSGGACVTIYSENKYQSRDLDFVMADYSLKELDPLMAELGFSRTRNDRHYENTDCPYFIEFPLSPLMVGEEFVKKTAIIKNKYGRLRLLRPVDSVKDRLAAFYHWNDRQSLEQALMVCKAKRINIKEIERWSKREGMMEKFLFFKDNLAG